jgi:hypothetical protein
VIFHISVKTNIIIQVTIRENWQRVFRKLEGNRIFTKTEDYNGIYKNCLFWIIHYQKSFIMQTSIKLCFILVLVFYSIDSYSQIEKPIKRGNIILGGGLSTGIYQANSNYNPINGSSQSKYSTTTISFARSTSFGYFVCNGLVLGISRSFSGSYKNDRYSLNNSSYNNSESFSYGDGLSPYIKYYFKNCIFLRFETGYSYVTGLNTTSDTKYKSNQFYFTPSFGYAIFITHKISIEPGINYRFSIDTRNSPSTDYNALNQQLFFSVGFQYFL